MNQVGTDIPDEIIIQNWKDVLDEMYGDNDSRKWEIYDIAQAEKMLVIQQRMAEDST